MMQVVAASQQSCSMRGPMDRQSMRGSLRTMILTLLTKAPGWVLRREGDKADKRPSAQVGGQPRELFVAAGARCIKFFLARAA